MPGWVLRSGWPRGIPGERSSASHRKLFRLSAGATPDRTGLAALRPYRNGHNGSGARCRSWQPPGAGRHRRRDRRSCSARAPAARPSPRSVLPPRGCSRARAQRVHCRTRRRTDWCQAPNGPFRPWAFAVPFRDAPAPCEVLIRLVRLLRAAAADCRSRCGQGASCATRSTPPWPACVRSVHGSGLRAWRSAPSSASFPRCSHLLTLSLARGGPLPQAWCRRISFTRPPVVSPADTSTPNRGRAGRRPPRRRLLQPHPRRSTSSRHRLHP